MPGAKDSGVRLLVFAAHDYRMHLDLHGRLRY